MLVYQKISPPKWGGCFPPLNTPPVHVYVKLALKCSYIVPCTDINVPVVTCHASKQSSKMMMEGDYTPSRLNALMNRRLVARNT